MSRQSKCCYTVVMSSFMNVPGFSLASLLCPAAAQAAAADTWAENSEEFGSCSMRRSAASLLLLTQPDAGMGDTFEDV